MPRPLLWATAVVLILAFALAGIRVLTEHQDRARAAHSSAESVERAVSILTSPHGPSKETAHTDAFAYEVLLENTEREIAPFLSNLTRDGEGAQAAVVHDVLGIAESQIETIRDPAKLAAALTPDARDITAAVDTMMSQETQRESLANGEALAGEIALVVVIGLLVLLALLLARRAMQSQLDRHAGELTALAERDPLTAVANRRRLNADTARARPGDVVAVMVIDLNGFKALNDRAGHAAGDHILVKVATAIVTAVGISGVTYRLGGDEFCVLASADDGSLLARVIDHLEEATAPHGVSASIGFAPVSSEDGDIARALALADVRMYEDKARGPARAISYP